MAKKKTDDTPVTDSDKLALIIEVMKRNGMSLPKELDPDEAED